MYSYSAGTGCMADEQRWWLACCWCCRSVGGCAAGPGAGPVGGGDDAVGGANMVVTRCRNRSPWRGACDPGCHLHLGWMLFGTCRNHCGMENPDSGAGDGATRRDCDRGDIAGCGGCCCYGGGGSGRSWEEEQELLIEGEANLKAVANKNKVQVQALA